MPGAGLPCSQQHATPFVSPQRNSRERWHQQHPTRRHPASRRPVRRTHRHASGTPKPSRCPVKMLACRAQCSAYATVCCQSPTSRYAGKCWQDARPPHEAPGERCFWLFVPLLHAAAGAPTQAAAHDWQCGRCVTARAYCAAFSQGYVPAALQVPLLQTYESVAVAFAAQLGAVRGACWCLAVWTAWVHLGCCLVVVGGCYLRS